MPFKPHWEIPHGSSSGLADAKLVVQTKPQFKEEMC